MSKQKECLKCSNIHSLGGKHNQVKKVSVVVGNTIFHTLFRLQLEIKWDLTSLCVGFQTNV